MCWVENLRCLLCLNLFKHKANMKFNMKLLISVLYMREKIICYLEGKWWPFKNLLLCSYGYVCSLFSGKREYRLRWKFYLCSKHTWEIYRTMLLELLCLRLKKEWWLSQTWFSALNDILSAFSWWNESTNYNQTFVSVI